jgi:hypothetical protein
MTHAKDADTRGIKINKIAKQGSFRNPFFENLTTAQS